MGEGLRSGLWYRVSMFMGIRERPWKKKAEDTGGMEKGRQATPTG